MLKIGKAAVLGGGNNGRGDCGASFKCRSADTFIRYCAEGVKRSGTEKGLPLDSFHVRNRIVGEMFEAAKKLKPAPFMFKDNASLIEIGNFEDDIHKLKDCDFVIEAIVENLGNQT